MKKEELEKKIEELEGKAQETEKKLEELNAEKEALMKELDEKTYLVVGKEDAARAIKDFICNKAIAHGEECKGIVRINSLIQEYLEGRPGAEFMIGGAPLGAINYFLQKFESHCLADAEIVDSIYVMIDQALGSCKEDTDKYTALDNTIKQLSAQLQVSKNQLEQAKIGIVDNEEE